MTEEEESRGVLLWRVKHLETQVQAQAQEIARIEERMAAREAERAEQEHKRLLAGISALGGVIIAMFGVLWAYRSIIFRGQE